MNKEEIFAMEPGKELNIRVAEDIMGHKVVMDEIFGDMEIYIDDNNDSVYSPLQPYSEDISAAQIVVAKMTKQGHSNATFLKEDSRPEVICRAALLTALQEREENSKKQRKSKLRIVD